MKKLCWSVEELRTGGSQGKTGEVTAKAGSLLATLNRNLAEILENYPQSLAAVTNKIQKSFKSLETIMKEALEKKRPAEGPPQSEPQKGQISASRDEIYLASISLHFALEFLMEL